MKFLFFTSAFKIFFIKFSPQFHYLSFVKFFHFFHVTVGRHNCPIQQKIRSKKKKKSLILIEYAMYDQHSIHFYLEKISFWEYLFKSENFQTLLYVRITFYCIIRNLKEQFFQTILQNHLLWRCRTVLHSNYKLINNLF